MFKFRLAPGCSDISNLREKSSDFLKSQGLSEDTIYAQMAILRELISSGKEIGNSNTAENEIGVLLLIENNSIIAEISKPVHESAFGQLDELDKTIQWIRGYQDPFEAYTNMRRDIAHKPDNQAPNGYGLAKIAYEAGAVVDFYVSEDNILNLSAVKNINGDAIA